MQSIQDGIRLSAGSIAINIILAIIKLTTGLVGHSSALIADGVESTGDIFSSLVVFGGLQIAARPPDEDHPYGHGKAESVTGLVTATFLVVAAVLISIQSIREIQNPGQPPAWYTLVVLGLIIFTKELLFRRMFRVGKDLQSAALQSDAWHHRFDAITSLAALIGIGIAFIGGPGFEAADDWAALLACGVIIFNASRLFRPALDEVMDAAVPPEIEAQIRRIAAGVEGVVEIEKCRIRKSGLGYLMDIHVVVDGLISVQQGHLIGHDVKDALIESEHPISDVIVHVEPGHPMR